MRSMAETIRKMTAVAGIALGAAHLIYGALAFKALTPEHIWFAGAGIAMICVGLSSWRAPARIEAVIMSLYLAIMASLMPLPQVFLGLAIFMILALPNLSRRKV